MRAPRCACHPARVDCRCIAPRLPSQHERATPPTHAGARRRHPTPPPAQEGKAGAAPVLVLLLIAAGLIVAAAVAAGGGVYAFGSSCDLSALHEVRIGQNTFVYAADGSLLGAIPAERNRQVVPLDRVSPWIPKATIAIEDRRFYSHGGVDPQGIARAVVADIRARSVVQGGSTITQQLVRNLYISNERTVQRKLKEACLAIKLNDAWSKQRILAAYLNQVYYGNLAYGIEAAAQTYFSKHARDLNLREAALLAGLTQAPSAYNPFVETGKAIARRDAVLAAMREHGTITEEQYAWAIRGRNLHLKPGRLYTEIREPYFFGYVRDQLVRRYGAETVRSGGLSVYTTIVPRWQQAAQQAIRETLTDPDDPAAAVISIDPANGAIRAMTAVVPGRRNNQFNLLSQARRQPGSTFKTFVLAAAIAKGIDPDTSSYVSAPFTYRPVENGNCEDGSWWCVKTYDSSYAGWSTISRATLRSDNTVYAQLTLDVGPDRVGEMARKLGVRSPLQVGGHYVPAMGLGSVAVSPLDMASAYATLAAGGVYSEPTAIRKVVLPNGKEDTEGRLGSPEADARDPRRSGVEGDPDPAGQRALRHRHPGVLRPAGGRQDGDDRQARGCLVRRLHAGSRDRRLDGVSAWRDPDGERPRHRSLGRQLPGRDVAPDDGEVDRAAAGQGLPGAERLSHLPDVPPGPARPQLRPVLRRSSRSEHGDDLHRDDADRHRPGAGEDDCDCSQRPRTREARPRGAGGRARPRARRVRLRARLAARLAARSPARRQRPRHGSALPRAPRRGVRRISPRAPRDPARRAGTAGRGRARRRDPARPARGAAPALDRRVDVLVVRLDRLEAAGTRTATRRRLPAEPRAPLHGQRLARHERPSTALRSPSPPSHSPSLAGGSDEVAAWTYKALAAAASLGAALLAGRLARRRGSRRRSSAGTPSSPSISPAAGTTTPGSEH